MPLKNAENTIEKAIQSVLNQIEINRELILIIGSDSSSDGSKKILDTYLNNSNIIIKDVNFGKAYLNRNFLNNYARDNFPNCVLIGRLDADDFLLNNQVISNIEKMFDTHQFDVFLCGNKQIKDGVILEWENKPKKELLDKQYLLGQVLEMSLGNTKAEFPSCNTFIKPTILIDYPNENSAEDHWFTVLLLLQKNKKNIYIDEDLLYCVYSLDGFTTNNNKKKDAYLKSRKKLYEFLKNQFVHE